MDIILSLITKNIEASVLLGLTLLGFSIQLFYYFNYYSKLSKHKDNPITAELPPVSIIVCAKNEADNLTKNLPLLLNQDYPNFEVVVVNDGSEDDTPNILAHFKAKHNNFYYTTIPHDNKFFHGKKLALTIGVKAAKHDRMVFTDADCFPQSTSWLKHIVSAPLNDNVVLGYGPYKKEKGFINRLQRYDTFLIAVQYLSFALKGKAYMAVGRNMAYSKKVFYSVEGFKRHSHILSGDDDLFIQEVASKNKVNICINPESHTISEARKTFSSWKNQKIRHLSTSALYKGSSKRIIGIEVFSRELFWCSAFISFFFSTFVFAIITLIFVKLVIQLIFLGKIAKRFNQKNIIWIGIILDFILPIITGFLFLKSKRSAKRIQWT